MKPSWTDNARIRGQQDDNIAYWCRRTVEAIDAEEPLRVTPKEYYDLRETLTDEVRQEILEESRFPARTNGCSHSLEMRGFSFPFIYPENWDTWPVEVTGTSASTA